MVTRTAVFGLLDASEEDGGFWLLDLEELFEDDSPFEEEGSFDDTCDDVPEDAVSEPVSDDGSPLLSSS